MRKKCRPDPGVSAFRDIKNPRWGLGLSDSQTRQPERLATLLLIGALACYALWLIALARWWIAEQGTVMLSRRQLNQALALLRSMAWVARI